MSAGKPRALFLDRDGTIIRDVGYPRDPAAVEFLPGAAKALRSARGLGYRLAIVSNQSGVARGLIQPKEAHDVQARVEELFREDGVSFDGAWFCFHGPDAGCPCRKPAPGLLLEAQRELGLDLARSIMIGDKVSDVEAGLAAGCAAVAFGGLENSRAERMFTSWDAFSEWLLVRSS